MGVSLALASVGRGGGTGRGAGRAGVQALLGYVLIM